jgi:hypothetical protein
VRECHQRSCRSPDLLNRGASLGGCRHSLAFLEDGERCRNSPIAPIGRRRLPRTAPCGSSASFRRRRPMNRSTPSESTSVRVDQIDPLPHRTPANREPHGFARWEGGELDASAWLVRNDQASGRNQRACCLAKVPFATATGCCCQRDSEGEWADNGQRSTSSECAEHAASVIGRRPRGLNPVSGSVRLRRVGQNAGMCTRAISQAAGLPARSSA